MNTLRVIIVDDKKMIVDDIERCLAMEADISVAGVAFDGQEAVGLVLKTMPDVVLMDIRMPVMDGIEAIRRIRQEAPSVEIVVLTVEASGKFLFDAFKAGAKGYLLKTATPDHIADAVRAVARGDSAVPPALVETMCEEFERIKQQTPKLVELVNKLTRSELQTLKCIGEGKTNSEIAEELFITEGPARTYVSNILRKLEVNNRIEAGYIAQASGLSKDF